MKIYKKSDFYIGRTYDFPKDSIIINRHYIKYEFLKIRCEKWFEQNSRCKEAVVLLTEYQKKRIRKIEQEEYWAGVPKEAKKELRKWNIINKSPYSESFYNAQNITWGHKPEGSLRVSDHWNFKTCDCEKQSDCDCEIHCKLKGVADKVENDWILAKYENGEYVELKRY